MATGTVGLLSRISDAQRRESVREERRRELEYWVQALKTVSNNLGVYFLFCLFGSAILAPFSLEFYASSTNKPVFLCFTSPSVAGFYVSIQFYRRGTLDFK